MGNAVALPIQPLPSLACSERRIYALCVAHCQAVSRVVRTLESQHVQASSTAAAARSDEPVGRAAGATSTAAEVLGFICSRRLDAALTTSACHCPQLVDLAFVQLLENAFSVKSPACACPACLPALPACQPSIWARSAWAPWLSSPLLDTLLLAGLCARCHLAPGAREAAVQAGISGTQAAPRGSRPGQRQAAATPAGGGGAPGGCRQ